MSNPLTERRGLSGSTLKLIAVITMLIDHTGLAVVGRGCIGSGAYNTPEIWMLYRVMRGIGRVAFPIFCFLLVVGFVNTRNVKKYLLRLILFGLISEVPFDLAVFGVPFYPGYQNVYWTLALGLAAMWLSARTENKWLGWLFAAGCGGLAYLFHTDYSWFGVLAIWLLYWFRENRPVQLGVTGAAFMYEIWAPIGLIPCALYNGKRGLSLKYLFYAFYPVHLFLLWAVARLCFGV